MGTKRTPSMHQRAFLTWLAVYCTLLAVQEVLAGAIIGLPLPLRTLLTTGIVVPVVVYGLLPVLLRAWQYAMARSRRKRGPRSA